MFPGLIAGAALLAAGADPVPEPPPLPPVRVANSPRVEALARYGAGVWQAHRDRLLSAAKSFEAAAALDPDATAPLRELVGIYAQAGREPEAIRVARLVLDKDPTDAATAHALSKLLHDAGDGKGALAAARVAAASPTLADRPDRALAVHRDLATLAEAADDVPAARAALRDALALLLTRRKAFLGAGGFTAQEADAALADTHERLGKVLAKLKDYPAAVEAFAAAHALYADATRANDPAAAARLDWNLAGVQLAKGDGAAALTHLDPVLARRPQAAEPYLRLAEALRLAGRAGDVGTALQRYADRDPKNHPLHAVLAAELARDAGTRAQADEIFARLDAATNDPAVVRLVVKSHVDSGRAGRVIADLDRAYRAAQDPDRARAGAEPDPEKRAFAAARARAIADALRPEPAWADAVLRAGAADLAGGVERASRTWHFLGILAARHRQLDLAARQYRQAIQAGRAETEAEGHAGLINVLWRQRKPREVATACRDGLRTARNTSAAFLNYHLAMALAELGEAENAVAAADRAVALGGEAARQDTQTRKVWVLRALGRHDDAVALARKVLADAVAPADRLRARYTLASALHSAKRLAESEAEYRAILDVDPDHAGACNDLGYHLADQGRNLDEAERLVRHAVETDRADRRKAGDPEPESASYLDSLGWVLFRRGKLPEARELLERATAIPEGEASGEIWDHLGDVCFRLGDKAKARAAYDQALTLYSADAHATRDGRPDEVRRKMKRLP